MKVWILMSEACYTGGKILGVYRDQESCQEAFRAALTKIWHTGTTTDYKDRTFSECIDALDYQDEIDMVYLRAEVWPLP